MEQLNDIIFYSVDKAIRTYRQFAQKQLRAAGHTITIDQWLIIKNIMENPTITQQEIAGRAFKDNASVTRIIDLLVKAKYLKRESAGRDRRRTVLKVTAEGRKVITDVQKVVLRNRARALDGISQKDLKQTRAVMEAIVRNCNS